MKSLFIGLIALSANIIILAKTPAIQETDRVLQALAPLLQANITASIINSTNSIQTTYSATLLAATQASYAVANASCTLLVAQNASIAINATQSSASNLAVNIQALITAQQNLVVAQSAQSSASQLAIIFDSLFLQATTASVAQTQANTQALLTTATALTQISSDQYDELNTILNMVVVNTTLSQQAASSNLGLNAGIPSFLLINVIATAINTMVTSLSTLVGTTQYATDIHTGVSTSQTASLPSSKSTQQLAAATQLQLALGDIGLISAQTDLSLVTANAQLAIAQTAANIAYGNFILAQQQLVSSQLATSMAVNQAFVGSQSSLASQIYSQGNSSAVISTLAVTTTQIAATQSLVNLQSQQIFYQCSTTKAQVKSAKSAQKKACKALSKKANSKDKLSRSIGCASANVQVQLGVQARAFACSN